MSAPLPVRALPTLLLKVQRGDAPVGHTIRVLPGMSTVVSTGVEAAVEPKAVMGRGRRRPVPELLTTAEVAKALGFTRWWVRRLYQRRLLAGVKLGPRALRFRNDDVLSWVEQRRRGTLAEGTR